MANTGHTAQTNQAKNSYTKAASLTKKKTEKYQAGTTYLFQYRSKYAKKRGCLKSARLENTEF
ncbi:hypothetical protein FBR06_07665 [Betaproteobacteria bacterium PRO4]|uniref:hypothetical protein n=1 Tax=Nitrosomonas sp. TaxID=42353 RepID=UPI00256CBB6F|nr:hypothetical protein [Nitrosomonas sp.]MDL1867105.1 hypothetical protein [Betaproteobacteria bacterium PRO4]